MAKDDGIETFNDKKGYLQSIVLWMALAMML